MADVVLDARTSNEELLGSIDKVLGNMEKKFDASVNNINAKLATIGSNLGQGLMSNLNSQLNSTEKKIDELQNKANRSSSSSASTKSININDYNQALNLDPTIGQLKDMKKKVVGYRESLSSSSQELKTANALYDKIDSGIKTATKSQRTLTLEQNQSNQSDSKAADQLINARNQQLSSLASKEQESAAAWAQFEADKQRGIKTTTEIQNQRYLKEQADLKKIAELKAAQSAKLWGQHELNASKEKLKTEKLSTKEIENQNRTSTRSNITFANALPENNIAQMEVKLKELESIQKRLYSNPILNQSEIDKVTLSVQKLNGKLVETKALQSQNSYSGVMGMSEKTLNDVANKMNAISTLRGNYGANTTEVSKLNQEYQRLSNVQKEALTSGVQLETKNNKLATSFENLGRRVLFYAGLGALTGFVEQIYDIRGQYEMLERSMGALLGDFAKGSALFNQIQAQALKSPFTVIDLSSAAKQLLAYNFAEGQVADTTKRLADISSALGVPIERLVYNTGQIKAKGFLDSRDARDYANSGLAIVPMLAKLYTEQKRNGEQAVTTSEVYDMMTKKMVSYGDVMAVINKATNDGGMFFDFQAKQAETLKGQMSNLVDAWNLMLNQIGKDNQGVLTGSVSLARTLFTNWREVENVILSLITAYGAYKTSQIVMNTLIGQGNTTITNSIIANKLKMASDLQRASLTRTLTTEENAFLLTRNKVTASDYAAALSTKGLRKEQLLLLATFNMRNTAFLQGLIRSNLLTAAEVRGALSAKGLSLAFNVLTLSAKTLGKSILGLLISNAPMIALTAIVGIISSMVAKHEEYKQKIKDVNDEYNNLRKNIADISVNFKIALLQKDNKGIDEARNQLNELIKLSKEQYNITFNIDTSKLNPKQIVETFNQIKNELDNLSIASRQFADSAIESNLGNTWDKYGQSIGKVYDIISSNKSVVVDALQSHINKLKQLGASQKDIQAEQLILNELMTPKKDNESQFDYLKRLVVAYNQLGIIGSNTDLFDKSTDQLRKLGIAGDETFKTLNTDWSELMSTGGDAIKAFNSQIDELAKRINLNALPKEQRTLQLEAAINKFATDKNLNEWSREAMLRLANEKYHTTIKIVDDKPSEDKTEFDIKSWQGRLQNWANRNKIILGLTLTVETTEVQAAQEALQKVQTAQEAVEIVKRKIKQGTASAVDLDAAKKNYKQQLEIAKAAGSDLSSLNKKADAERRKAEAAQKKALSEEAQAIKNEIDLIDKLSSNYDKLTKAGMSSTDAISLLNDEYKNSITAINSVLGKYKLPDFNVKEFAGKDVSGQLDYLEKLRNAMKTKGLDKLKPDAFKEVSVQIQKIKVEGKVYDLTKITDGLQESLSNIKESYELGIEIDTESGLGDVFSTMFGIDRSKLPKDAEDAVKQMTDEWNKAVDRYNAVNIKSPIKKIDILSTTPQQFNEIQNVNVKSGIAENYKKVFDTVYGIAKADAEKTIKEYNDLNYKLADNAGKIGIEEQKLSLLQTRYAQETNNEKKRLLELQITDEKRTIEQLKEESLKLVPFYRDLFADTYNKSNATLERIIEKVKEVTNTAKEVDVNGEKKIQLSFPDQSGEIKKTTISAEEYLRILKQIDSLTQKTTESNPWKKISDDFSKVTIDGKTQLKNPKEGLKDLAAEGHKAADGVKELSQIFSDLGASDDTVETLSDIGTTIDGISTAAEGAAQIASGDVIGGTVNVIKGTWTAVSTWFDNKNKKIDKQIKESELTVKNLENAYKNLEYAVSHSLGTAETMAKKAEIANKKLQLTELQRQLTLEQSRSSKKRDDSKIADLQGQIIELQNGIKDLTDSIVNDLLGSDIKSAAEDFAKTWITAWQQGENTIESLKSKFTDMIDTMIVKSLASAIVAKRLQGIYDLVTQFTDDKSEGGAALTTDEINIIRQKTGSNLVDKINQDLTNVMNALGINYGSGNNNNLSDLQQGIQSVSEETAGALEGYMNGVSGQVYLHTTQLQQLLNNSNVSLGVQSQILLALQNGYQVQQSIQGLLEGWSSSNGRSIKVEMIK